MKSCLFIRKTEHCAVQDCAAQKAAACSLKAIRAGVFCDRRASLLAWMKHTWAHIHHEEKHFCLQRLENQQEKTVEGWGDRRKRWIIRAVSGFHSLLRRPQWDYWIGCPLQSLQAMQRLWRLCWSPQRGLVAQDDWRSIEFYCKQKEANHFWLCPKSF